MDNLRKLRTGPFSTHVNQGAYLSLPKHGGINQFIESPKVM